MVSVPVCLQCPVPIVDKWWSCIIYSRIICGKNKLAIGKFCFQLNSQIRFTILRYGPITSSWYTVLQIHIGKILVNVYGFNMAPLLNGDASVISEMSKYRINQCSWQWSWEFITNTKFVPLIVFCSMSWWLRHNEQQCVSGVLVFEDNYSFVYSKFSLFCSQCSTVETKCHVSPLDFNVSEMEDAYLVTLLHEYKCI